MVSARSAVTGEQTGAVRSLGRLTGVALTDSRCSPSTAGALSSVEDGAQAWFIRLSPDGNCYLNTSLTFACLPEISGARPAASTTCRRARPPLNVRVGGQPT